MRYKKNENPFAAISKRRKKQLAVRRLKQEEAEKALNKSKVISEKEFNVKRKTLLDVFIEYTICLIIVATLMLPMWFLMSFSEGFAAAYGFIWLFILRYLTRNNE